MADKNKVGLVGATVFGGVHVVWVVFVATGVAQAIYDYILWAHMIHLKLVVGPFDLTAAASLVILTGIIGYMIGYAGALVWNKVHAQ